ncbi:M14 family zinc carboxypeptidase [Streptomyces sp. NPDC058614]|uniref:M14 family zinc carboxypeptidase n=1 Tax=Streptomyces sp. NPDC058614 TaxID=3346557 RepID=UPI00365299FA
MTEQTVAVGDPIQDAQQEVERARQAGDEPRLARALITLSALLTSAGRHAEAIAAAEEGTAIFRELNDARLAWALQNLAARYSAAGQHDKSVPPAKERCDILRRLGDQAGLGEALITLSGYLTHAKAHEEAIEAAEEGTAIFRELNDGRLEWALQNLAARYSAAGQHDRSVPPAQERCDILRRLGDRPGLAQALVMLGGYLQHARRHDESIAAGSEGAAVYRELQNESGLAWALQNLAQRFSAANRHQESVPPQRECCDIHRRRGDRSALAQALIFLGNYLQHARAHAESIAVTVEGTGLYRELRNASGKAWAIQNLNARYGAAPWLRVKRADLSAPDSEQLRAIIRELTLDAVGGISLGEPGGPGVATATVFTTVEQLDVVEERGITVTVVDDDTATGLARQDEVGEGNRFEGGAVPSGLGVPGGTGLGDRYLNVDEVDTAVRNLAAAYPDTCRLITLPYPTVEQRTVHALRIGVGAEHVDSRPTVLLMGGAHAREWGSCEILVNLAADLLQAHRDGTGLRYGGREIAGAEVRALMERLQFVVLPVNNPDGRHYSQFYERLWRKNRNPTDTPSVVGVDVNRNYEFLFDLAKDWAPEASGGEVHAYTSAVAANDTYQGPDPFSEAESRNVRWLLDTHQRVRWLVDVHSFKGMIGYNWNSDDNQTVDPAMNFDSPTYDGQRGVTERLHAGTPEAAAYREYLPPTDLALIQTLAQSFTQGLAAVRGTEYLAAQGASLYVTACTVDDYVYARHVVNPGREKVNGFFVEWGREFQPLWTEMTEIVREVTSGLLSFCQRAALETADVATVTRDPDWMDVFAVGTDGVPRVAWWNGNWNDWQPLGTHTFAPRTPITALSRDSDWMDIFTVGTDGSVRVAWWNGSWNDWQPIYSQKFAPGTVIAGQSRNSDQMDLFAVGTDGRVHNSWWNGQWNDWIPIGTKTFGTGTPVTTLNRGADFMDVYAVGEDGRVHVAWWNGGWNEWQPIGTRTFAPNTRVAAQSRNDDQMDLFAVGTDGLVYNAWWHGNWSEWQSIGERTFTTGTPVTTLTRDPDWMDVFAVGRDGRVYVAWWNGGWNEWQPIGTRTFAPNTRIAAQSRNDDQMDLFAVGTDGLVYNAWWHGNWSEWQPVGTHVF